MSYCPVCGSEFREGIEKCSDCGVVLTDKAPETRGGPDADTEAVWLCDVADSFQYMMLKGLLEHEGIPHLRRFYEPSGELMEIYAGRSDYRAAIYVPAGLLERARGLMP